MVEVMKLQRQKKCIRAAVKSSALARKPLRLFLFLEWTFPFPRSNFIFLDLDCLTSLRSVRQLSDLEKKVWSRKRKSSLSEKKLRLRIFPALSSLFPAARNIYLVYAALALEAIFIDTYLSVLDGIRPNSDENEIISSYINFTEFLIFLLWQWILKNYL